MLLGILACICMSIKMIFFVGDNLACTYVALVFCGFKRPYINTTWHEINHRHSENFTPTKNSRCTVCMTTSRSYVESLHAPLQIIATLQIH